MGIYKRGNIWWYKFKKDGRPYYKSSESVDPGEAERLLRIAQGDVARGKTPIVIFNQVTLDELAEDFLADLKIKKGKTIDHAERYVKELKNFFGNAKVTQITTTKIRKYIEKRQEDGLADASINRELSALNRMFHLAAKADPPKIDKPRWIPMLSEDNVRKGFFEYDEYEALYQALPEYLKPVLTFGYFSGWRVMEILNLKWNRLDLEQGKAWIAPGETKNKEGREIYLDDDLLSKLQVLRAKRNPLCPYVFQRDGQRIKRFTKAWETASRQAGLWAFDERKGRMAPTKIFHDLRRTSAREDIRAGTPVSVVMKKSGWKTMSMFLRYNITDEKDLRQAAEMRRLRVLALQEGGRGDNRGDSGAVFDAIGLEKSKDNSLQSLENAPVAQVDRARDS